MANEGETADLIKAIKAQMDALKSLSETMLVAARAQQWGQVAEYDTKRMALMQALFERVDYRSGAIDLAWFRQEVELLKRLDDELVELGKKAQDEAARLLKELRAGKQAAHKYQEYTFTDH